MEVLAYLIPVALLLGIAGLGAFFWSLKSGQFDDLDGAAMRILIDDEAALHKTKTDQSESKPGSSESQKQDVDPKGELK